MELDSKTARMAGGATFSEYTAQANKFVQRRRYSDALGVYQKALRFGMEMKQNPLVLRYFSECAIDCLELQQEYGSVLEYLDEILRRHLDIEEPTAATDKDLASTYLKKTIVCLKMGDAELAEESLESCLDISSDDSIELNFALKIKEWMAQGKSISAQRLEQEQKRRGLFTVFN